MKAVSRSAQAYIAVVVGVGLSVFLWLPGHIAWGSALAFLAAFALVEAFPVVRRGDELITISGTLACLALAAHGPKTAALVAVAGSLLACVYMRVPLLKTIYNAGQYGVEIGAASLVFLALGGEPGLSTTQLIVPFLGGYVAFWLTNTLLMSVLLGLLQSGSVWSLFASEVRSFSAQQGLVMIVNCTVLATYGVFGEWALVIFTIILLLVRYALAAYEKARGFYMRLITMLTGVMEAHDSFTHGHSERVAHYASVVGKQMNLSEAQLDTLHTAALLHDVGKMIIPREILQKATPLTDEEMGKIREHPVTGASWVERFDEGGTVARVIRHHHERWDGHGYPDGLSGENIPQLARIITVVDAFDAMISDRPYRRGMSPAQALKVLQSEAGRQFDPVVVVAFTQCFEQATRDLPVASVAAFAAAARHDVYPDD